MFTTAVIFVRFFPADWTTKAMPFVLSLAVWTGALNEGLSTSYRKNNAAFAPDAV